MCLKINRSAIPMGINEQKIILKVYTVPDIAAIVGDKTRRNEKYSMPIATMLHVKRCHLCPLDMQ